MALAVPPEYGYVLATATLSVFVNQGIASTVGWHRYQAKVPFPNAYVSHAEAKEDQAKHRFNCAQRAHANFLEHWPSMLVGLAAGGLQYPIWSSGLGLAWLVARVAYIVGYTNVNKPQGKGRSIGNWFYLPELGLQILAGLTAYKLLVG